MAQVKANRSDFAKIMGVDRAQVTRWVERGLPTVANGDVSVVDGADWVRANVKGDQIRRSRGAGQITAAEHARFNLRLVTAMYLDCEYAARYTAEALRPLLPTDTVRGVVTQILCLLRADAASSLEEDVQPPKGMSRWKKDPRFSGDQPREFEWGEVLPDHPVAVSAASGGPAIGSCG